MLSVSGLVGILVLPCMLTFAPDVEAPGTPLTTAPWVQAQATVEPDEPVQRLWQVLDMQTMMPILRQEAVNEAARLQAEGLIQGNGRSWPEVVAQIHHDARLEALFRDGASAALARVDGQLLAEGLEFYETELGRRMVGLETSARRALLQEEVEASATEDFARARADGNPRAEQILRLIDGADLVAPNVASGLNASVAFSRGFAEGGGFDMPLTEQQMMAEAWAQQEQIEADATNWLQGFLMLAYSPLTDTEMEDYIAFATSPAGKILAQILYGAFDRVFARTSYDMGLAAALRLQGRRL
ncbi:hypothetical protein [Paracoccus sp. (in: a-proteobacteria)]|uniref:hypothetical protein n=1 Tax=Paracoccus sp. TaxID=267 RepID=UPI00396CA0D9